MQFGLTVLVGEIDYRRPNTGTDSTALSSSSAPDSLSREGTINPTRPKRNKVFTVKQTPDTPA